MKKYLDFAAPNGATGTTPVTTIAIVDISASMDADDYKPTRLRAACEAVTALIQEKRKSRPNDRVSVVAFSESAVVAHTPTSVHNETDLARSLRRLQSRSSTNFAAGLKMAGDLFARERHPQQLKPTFLSMLLGINATESPGKGFVPHGVFLSDGHHTGGGNGNPVTAARRLKERHGVILECIGIGGSPSDVDEKLLRKMASIGPDGQPRYRFIGDTATLVKDFRRMAQLKLL